MAQATDCCLPLSRLTHWLISLAGQRCWRMQVTRLSKRRYSSRLTVFVLFVPIPRCSRSVLAATPGCPASPVQPTCVTDRAPAVSRSSGAPRCGLVLGRSHRTVQPASASPDRLPVPRTHPAGPVRRAVVLLAANPVHLVAFGSIAPGHSPAKG